MKDTMRIISRSKIIAYYTGDPNSRTALEEWFQKAREADWMCFADMKRTFRSVDSVGNQHFVFNIHGNSYRLVAVVKFTIKYIAMARITNEAAYKAIMERVDELLPLVDDDTPLTDKNLVELDLLSELAAEYEEEHYPIAAPSLPEVIRLRMAEMGINQTKLSEMLGVSPSRVSDYLTGRSEPTLRVGREISRKLGIDAGIVLGV